MVKRSRRLDKNAKLSHACGSRHDEQLQFSPAYLDSSSSESFKWSIHKQTLLHVNARKTGRREPVMRSTCLRMFQLNNRIINTRTAKDNRETEKFSRIGKKRDSPPMYAERGPGSAAGSPRRPHRHIPDDHPACLALARCPGRVCAQLRTNRAPSPRRGWSEPEQGSGSLKTSWCQFPREDPGVKHDSQPKNNNRLGRSRGR